MKWTCLFVLPLVGLLVACDSPNPNALFTRLPSDSTGVTFANEVDDRPGRHILNYTYLYNGGGVAVGDVNGDDRPDLYFTANTRTNALYLNQGDFQFRDVTEEAGVQDSLGWTTGVTMADVNGDGRLDIYVCKAGNTGDTPRRNKLYLNDGDGTFSERAAEYGLNAPAYSVHATFFDYDRDGDLDLYLLNNPPIRDSRISSRTTLQQRRAFANDQLYRNDGDASEPRFVNVTEEAGLKHDAIGFGLSATVSDINRDGWPDVYVANDFDVEDRLYLNQGDGTFAESIHDWIDHMPRSAMGADIADYNNDSWPDLYVADMLPEDNRRQKLLNIGQRPRVGEQVQFVRNMLQLNNKNGSFSEIGQLAGVSNTDWSWAALFADFDLDGLKDLYVTNGIRYDYTNMDFQFSDYVPASQKQEVGPEDLYTLIEKMPSTPLPNYIFRNQGDLTFEKKIEEWGMTKKGFSNGAAYADLNNDGALDLVVNNVDEEARIYRNNARTQTDHRFLRVKLEGTGQNQFGIGAKVQVTTPSGDTLFQEMMPARGFQSSVEPVLTFGVGEADTVDVTVTWPNRLQQSISEVRTDQTLTLRQEEAQPTTPIPESPDRSLEVVDPARQGLSFTHQENSYEDYRDQPLMTHMLARLGPALARGDVNGDGREDVFVGGARDQVSSLFVQRTDGTFESVAVEPFEEDRSYEDVDATFIDVNGDGDQDLYVVSGGRSIARSEAYQDRLYLNDGTGTFEAALDRLPSIESSGGTVASHDYDGDGDVDLFVGGRVRPLKYPLSPRSYLLENTGGRFQDVTAEAGDALRRPGMVTDAHWADLTGDGAGELVMAGEWMPIRVFQREGNGAFTERTGDLGLDRSNGWWNRLRLVDLDGDGNLNLVAGNWGTNAQIRARQDEPAFLYAADFDDDGDIEPIMSHHIDGTEYPIPRRNRMMDALSLFRARFQTYESYAEATMEEVLLERQWEKAQHFRAHTFTTSVFEQRDDGTFTRHDLPTEAQFSPTRGILVHDVNEDGRPDLLLAGNDFTVRQPWGPSDAGKGVLLLNRGDLEFEAQRPHQSGFFAPGDVRDLLLVPSPETSHVVVGNNGGPLDLFEISRSSTEVGPRALSR